MKFFTFCLFIVLVTLTTGHFSELSSEEEKDCCETSPSQSLHVLSLDDFLKSYFLNDQILKQGKPSPKRNPAQTHKWVAEASRVQFVVSSLENSLPSFQKIESIHNKTNGFTATVFETSRGFFTDFIVLNKGLNEIELSFRKDRGGKNPPQRTPSSEKKISLKEKALSEKEVSLEKNPSSSSHKETISLWFESQ
jgi:hypothetical protein